MRTSGRLAASFILLLAMAFPAASQGPIGIAFVEAPEQGGGVCVADNVDSAFACAKQQCTSEGADARDCYRVGWCYPAGWSADIFFQNQEGFHGHNYLCGWESRDDLEAAIAVKCDRASKPYLMECLPVRMWDNDGQEVALE